MYIKLDGYTKTTTVRLDEFRYNSLIEQYPGWDVLGEFQETIIEEKTFYDGNTTRKQLVPHYNKVWILGHRGSMAEEKVAEAKVLRGQVSALNSEKNELVNTTSTEIKNLKSNVGSLEYDLKNSKANEKIAKDSELVKLAAMRLMEQDLAKVRKAIGDLQFNNILGIVSK